MGVLVHGTQAHHSRSRPSNRQTAARRCRLSWTGTVPGTQTRRWATLHEDIRDGTSAARWLAEVQVDHDRGLFADRSEAERHTLKRIIERYKEEVLGEDSEKRGAEKERGHLKVVLEDPVCKIRMAS